MQSEGQKGYFRGYVAACKRRVQESEPGTPERERADVALREAREAQDRVADVVAHGVVAC